MSANASLDLLFLPQHVATLATISSSHSLRVEEGHHSLPSPTPLEDWLCSICGKM